MRVLLISHTFPPDMGGASARAWNVAKGLLNAGHAVSVIAGRPYYPQGSVPPEYLRKFIRWETLGGVRILRVWIPALPTVGLWRRIVIYLGFVVSYTASFISLRRNFDVLYYLSPYPLSLLSVPASLYGKLSGAMVLLDVHDLWPEVILEVGMIHSKTAARILGAMTRVAASLSDYLTPIADSIGKRTARLGVPFSKIHTIWPGVDTAFFRPSGVSDTIRGKFGGKFVLEYSGILARRYDFETLLDAAKILESSKDVVILIRGEGEMRDWLRSSVSHSPNVVLITDVVSSKEVVEYLNIADILICPLRPSIEAESSIPLKVVEYLAVGRPVLCSAAGDLEALIKETGVGMVVAPGDAKAFAQAAISLLRDKDLRSELARNARSVAEKRFSLPSIAAHVEQLYSRYHSRSR